MESSEDPDAITTSVSESRRERSGWRRRIVVGLLNADADAPQPSDRRIAPRASCESALPKRMIASALADPGLVRSVVLRALDVTDLRTSELLQEIVALRRRVRKLTALLRLAVALVVSIKSTYRQRWNAVTHHCEPFAVEHHRSAAARCGR